MGKIYNKFIELKKENFDILYLFKCGAFYIFINEDAAIASDILNLKLNPFGNDAIKCGFPICSYEKYVTLLHLRGYSVKIFDIYNNKEFDPEDFINNESVRILIDNILSVDIDNLSISQAFCFISDIQKQFFTIRGKISNDKNN